MSVNKNILFLISNIRDYIDRLETLIKRNNHSKDKLDINQTLYDIANLSSRLSYNNMHLQMVADVGRRNATIPDLSEEMCTTFLEESGFKVEKVEGFEHDWFIFTDNPIGCTIAIHKDVINPKYAKDGIKTAFPAEGIFRIAPGSVTLNRDDIGAMHMDIHHIHTLWDDGYLNDNAHLIITRPTKMVSLEYLEQAMKYVHHYMENHTCTEEDCPDCETELSLTDMIGAAS